MAGASLLTLLDDITTLLDDVSVMTKVAARKTAGVLGDDLALNAQQVTGVNADRELPVVWAVAKGSLLNKAILVPAALAISAWLPWAIQWLMMIGGAYLCFEGVEKLVHVLFHRGDKHAQAEAHVEAEPAQDPAALEKSKIKGAIRTDFILSAEIIVLALGVVAGEPLLQQVLVLIAVAVAITLGVYGLVGGIVKLDDLGLWLLRRGGAAAIPGRMLLVAAPWLMRLLSVVGTVAMFLVGGGILMHNLPIALLHHWAEPAGPGLLAATLPHLAALLVGVVAGALVLAVVSTASRLMRGQAKA